MSCGSGLINDITTLIPRDTWNTAIWGNALMLDQFEAFS